MPRPKEWERIARDQHISLQAYIQSVLKLTEELVMQSQDPWSRVKALEIDREATAALEFSRELQALIEDNNRTAADLEREAIRRTYRTKEGK